jgi:hypothetical protein
MRRTDSWWTRFSRTTLLNRRLSDASRTSGTNGIFEIRDPKPPPHLDAIAENIHLVSRSESSRTSQEPLPHQQQGPILGREASMVYKTNHGKSVSSLRTVDSEAIERMAGTMDVFQRINTSNSHRTTGSINSSGGRSIDTLRSLDAGHDNHVSSGGTSQGIMPDDPLAVSPSLPAPGSHYALEYFPPQLSSPPLLPMPSSPKDCLIGSPQLLPSKSTLVSPSSPNVADRIHAFESRMSLGQTSSPPAATTRHREERTKKRVTVDYGLVPRASLFVANPDSHLLSTSGDS